MATDTLTPFNLQRFIISIILVGITLVIGIYVVASLGIEMRVDVTTTGTNTNETLTSVDNITATSFAVLATDSGSACTLTAIFNATSGQPILTGNYTQPTSCTILANGSAVYNGSNWNVTYGFSYTASTATDSSNAADGVVTALATGTSWVSILVVVGFATIVLSMLTSGLGQSGRRKEEEATPFY